VNGDYYKVMAEEKAEREITKTAPRGEILDRNGIKLATNKQCFNIIYTNTKLQDEKINEVLYDTINIIYKNGDQDKLNLQSLPISYDAKTDTFALALILMMKRLLKNLQINLRMIIK
jgi:penicillin-binding protein 2